ncbi:MAG: hypothetical protein GKS04_03755 [Candidatus Mycalebacterium zealandia]|nr:MAG: hypothetical protein GKS04_03755 [Candidatus Mycalebacterium zealandia]
MRPLILLTVLASFLFSSCAGAPFPREIFDREDVFKIWAVADTQPVNPSHRRAFENAVEDFNLNTSNVHMALVAGDIVNSASEEVFDWYLATRSKSYITMWNEIAGNHDVKPDGGALFRKKIGKFNKTITRGNILFILVSDEDGTKPTVISDKSFEWWKKTVENNRDKILVVMTHAPLEGSSIVFSGLRDRQITNSQRFTEVLKKEKVDLWLSGHTHVPHFFPRTIKKKDNLNGVVFVHISSIRPEVGGLKHPESRFLAFYCGTKKLSVFSRNHKKRKWQNRHAKHFMLSKTVECP